MKNNFKLVGIAFMVIMMFFSCTKTQAQRANPESDFTARPIDGGKAVEITGYIGSSWTVNIPSRIQGLPVTQIGAGAFANNYNITSVTIPNSVASIGDMAFLLCNSLTSVTIPNSVTSIGKYAISNCNSLTSITIPNSVTSIGEYAFYDCKSLASINVNANNTAYSSADGVFYNKTKTTLILFPAGKIGNSFTIPNSVASIGDHAFIDCTNLTSVTIPNSVTSIGDYAFSDCKSISSITIPNSVTSIGDYAFSDCNSLASITIPNSVTTIAINAFSSCSSFTSITIGANMSKINDYWVEIKEGVYKGAYSSAGFIESYNRTGRLAGTYTRPNTTSTTWTRQ